MARELSITVILDIFLKQCLSHLGIYKVGTYHGYEGLSILYMQFIGEGQTTVWTFTGCHSNDFVTGGFSKCHKIIIIMSINDRKSNLSSFITWLWIVFSLFQRVSVPWSALTDEDQGAHNDTGQGDAHANNDPCHGPLVYVVETIREHWKINNVLI